MTVKTMIGWVLAVLSPRIASASTPASAQTRAPLVLAAASLQESMTAAAAAWAKKGHSKPILSFAASSALARQVLAGGAADLFVSADEEWMDALAAKRLIVAATRSDFLGNRLVVVELRGKRTRIPLRPAAALARTLGAGPLAMADTSGVPAGKYGKAALQRLGAWTAIAPNVVQAENVRAALALVERGAAPLGIVYATDARASQAVRVAGVFPQASHPPIVYPIARLTASTNPEARGVPPPSSSHAKARRSSSSSASPRGEDLPRMLTPDEWGIVALSLQVGGVALLVTLPIAFALAWLLARGRFPGKMLLDALVHLPLVVPPVVTGWLLLLAFAPTGAIGAMLQSMFGVSVLFRWTGAAIACGDHGAAADGARDAAVDRGGGPAAGKRRRDARRRPLADLRDDHLAAQPAGHPCGCGARICTRDRRIRRDDHLRRQRAGQTQTLPLAIYSGAAAAGWRGDGAAARGDLRRAVARRADHLRTARAA